MAACAVVAGSLTGVLKGRGDCLFSYGIALGAGEFASPESAPPALGYLEHPGERGLGLRPSLLLLA